MCDHGSVRCVVVVRYELRREKKMEDKKLDLNEVIETVKKVNELKKCGIIEISSFSPRIQMDDEMFFEIFGRREDIEETVYQDMKYPYEYKFIEQNVEIICLTDSRVDLKALREQLREQDA